MSTRIYKGFMIDTPDIHEVMDLIKAFRPTIETLALNMAKSFIANSGTWNEWFERRRAVEQLRRDPVVDTQFQLLLFPHAEYNCFYGIAYTEHQKWFDLWLTQPGVSFFGYWNNSDPEDGLSEEEWNKRGELWDKIIQPEIPSMAGLSIEVMNPRGPPIWDLRG